MYVRTYIRTCICKGQDALSRHTHRQHKQQCNPNYSMSLLLANATLAVIFAQKSCLHTECDARREECQCCHKELSMPTGISSMWVNSSGALGCMEGVAMGGVLKPLVCAAESCSMPVKEEQPSNNSIQPCAPHESFSLISHVAQCQQVTTGTSDPSGMHSLVNEGTNTPPSCPEITLHPQ